MLLGLIRILLLIVVEVSKDLVELSLHLLNLGIVFFAFLIACFLLVLRLVFVLLLAIVALPSHVSIASEVLSELALFISSFLFSLLAQKLGHILKLLRLLRTELRGGRSGCRHLISINCILRRQMEGYVLL